MSAERRYGSLEIGEVISFAVTAAVMLASSLVFPSFYWLFILLALSDGLATRFENELLLSFDRIFYAVVVVFPGAVVLGLDVPGMILETVLLIAFVDIVFLLRQIRSESDFIPIIASRLRSYVYTLVPAGLFAAGLTYIGVSVISASMVSANAILELGLTSAAVFLLILFLATHPPENMK